MSHLSPAVRWTVYVLVAALFAVACGFLSHWQFSRNEWRAAQIELVERNYDAAPVAVSELIGEDGAFDPDDEWRPVEITGEYQHESQLLVRNRARGGTSAFEVVVPIRTEDGRLFAVDRGWVRPGEDSSPTAVPAAPEGVVTVVARLRPSEPLPNSGRSAPEGQLPTLHVPSVAEVAGPETIPSVYGLLVSESPEPAEAPYEIDPPTEDPGPYLSYAIQWILFGVMGFAFIGYMIRTEIVAARDDASGDDPDDLGDADPDSPPAPPRPPRRAPRPKRRDRDMEEEDALLDA